MKLKGYKNSYENVELFSENADIIPKKLTIRNFSNILDTIYPNTNGRMNVQVYDGAYMEASIQFDIQFGFDELINRGTVVIYRVPSHYITNEFGQVEELYQIATYQNGKPNYSHYFTKDEIDTKEKFYDHLLVCANALIDDLPF